MQIIYFKVECLFPELLPSSTVTLKEVVLTRENEVISTFSNLKINSLPFYSFHLVPVGSEKLNMLLKASRVSIYSSPQVICPQVNTGLKRLPVRKCWVMMRLRAFGGWLMRMRRRDTSRPMSLFHGVFRLFDL